MKIFRCWLAFLCLLFGLRQGAGCAGLDFLTPVNEAAKAHSERVDRSWRHFHNSDLGYCVSYPSHWAKGDAFDGKGLYVRTGMRHSPRPVAEIDLGPIDIDTPDARLRPVRFEEEELDQNLREHLDGLQKFVRAERIEIVDQRHLTLLGGTALFAKNRYYDPLERSQWLEEVVFVAVHRQLFRIELQCAPDQAGRFEPVFAHLVKSFEMNCKQ